MHEKDIDALLKKYNAGECSPEEVAFLEAWFAQWNQKIPLGLSPEELAEDLVQISARTAALRETHRVRHLWPRVAAAASVILALSAGGYFLLHKPDVPEKVVSRVKKQDAVPGQHQATLTLANGQKIVLTRGLSGKLGQQGTTAILVNSDEAVAYTGSGSSGSANTYNSLSTARGERSPYPLVLADGTKIWLNAASSVTFPVAFSGQERRIRLTGQAYIEVMHKADQPFYVETRDQVIKDIGTRFDVNAYPDEPAVRTTLVEGAVEVTAHDRSIRLKPDEQAINTGTGLRRAGTDAAEMITWKDGHAHFDHADIPEVMRVISRWYKLEVVYEGPVPKREFSGDISLDVNASRALKILEYLKIGFEIDKDKIKIKNN